MSTIAVADGEIAAWCRRHLGSEPAEVLFTMRHLSSVSGLALRDGRQIVLKIRPMARRLVACAAVHRHLHAAGFPCPQPLAGPEPLAGYAADAELLVPGGDLIVHSPAPARVHAGLLAQLIKLAPPAGSVGTLKPAPPWTAWDHTYPKVWPPADDRPDDLNSQPSWLDDVATEVRALLSGSTGPDVIGHGDFEAQNLRWNGDVALAVHDWDSVICAPEPVVVGLAAAVWPAGITSASATVDETAAFLDAYQTARGAAWSAGDLSTAWAAGLWVLVFNAKKASFDGYATLDRAEADERLRRALNRAARA
jgi:Ser/Thr protein kinase RdoA (MazF antagonist)